MAPKKAGASKRMEHPVRAQSSALLETTAAGGTGNAPDEAQGAANERSKCMSEYDYVNVIVTPKLTFQLLRRPEWKTVQDISQDELRRGFLGRFPPAMWMSSEKFSFRPTLPPTAQITEDTHSLVFKLVSDEVPDERVMLGILRELEKSYEARMRQALIETRSEAMQEQLMHQEQAEEARREQEKQVKDLKKDNKSLRDQLQSIQKRLFLVEQEKDQLQKEQHQVKERMVRVERENIEQTASLKSEQQEIREQLETLRHAAELASSSAAKAASSGPLPADAWQANFSFGELPTETPSATKTAHAVRWSDLTDQVDAITQTDDLAPNDVPGATKQEVNDVSHRVDLMQQQMRALQGWLTHGSQLLLQPGTDEAK